MAKAEGGLTVPAAGRIALAFGAALFAGAAGAEFRPGAWDIAELGGHRKCRLMLGAGGRGAAEAPARIPATCRRAFPALRLVQTWRPLDAARVALAEPGGRVALEFSRSGEAWAADAGGVRVELTRAGDDPRSARELPPLYVRPAPAPVPEAARLSEAEIPGAWRAARGVSPDGCALNLTDRPTAGAARVAELEAVCADRGLVTFAPVAWRYEGGRIVLIAKKGHDIRFAWDAAGNRWRKDPASGAELYLAR